MAEAPEEKSALDSLLAADDADIATLMEQQKVSEGETTIDPAATEETPPPEETAPEEKPAEETPPEEKPPPVEEPPPEEKPPVIEAKPEEKPPEKPPVDRNDWAWKELRRMKREQKEREAAAAKPPEPTKPAANEFDDFDPIEQIRREAAEATRIAKEATARAEQAEQNARVEAEARAHVDEINRQEAAFKQTHPDYDEALNFVVESRTAQFEAMGKIDADARMWIDKQPDLVARHAEETGKNPDDFNDIREAARDIALRVAIHQDRQMFLASCKASGKNVAQAVYTMAEKMGRRVQAEAPAVENKKPAALNGQEKVQKAKEQAEKQKGFSQSLAAMTPPSAPLSKKISSRKELMALSEKDQDKLIAQKDVEDPDWFSNLED